MDIKFNATAAEQLIQEMSTYCSGIYDESRELLSILNHSDTWSDNQEKAFHNNVVEIANDLNKVLSLESEYMRTFHQRVNELRGK